MIFLIFYFQDQNFFEVKGLEPKSQYFFQVEVIAQYGITRLKSDAESIVVNITNYSNGNGNNEYLNITTLLQMYLYLK